MNLRLFYGSKDKSSRQLYPICDAAAAGGGIEGLRILEENLLFPDEEIDQQRGGGDGAFLKMPRPQLAYFLPVTVHSVTSNLRKSILNSLRQPFLMNLCFCPGTHIFPAFEYTIPLVFQGGFIYEKAIIGALSCCGNGGAATACVFTEGGEE
ncbi:hypothetical protein AALC75_12910 [Lachnospiraceae bacterium 48-42]